MTLAEFVAARMEERWEQAQRDIGYHRAYAEEVTNPTLKARALHIAALCEGIARTVEAQRRTLARHTECAQGGGRCADGGHGWDAGHGCDELADLAAPDHAHPDFNPAWKDA